MNFEVPGYALIKKLGDGAMADVWLAEHLIHKRKAAIKILKPSTLQDSDVNELFRREGEALAGFRSDYIVAIYDIGKVGPLGFIVMEYLPGSSLYDRIRRGNIPLWEAIGLVIQVAQALDITHQAKIVHRDLKPANLLFRDSVSPVLADFGTVRILGRTTIYGRDGGVVGTPPYMSPEQVTGGELDGRSDLYALGIMFHELLTGEVPFSGADPHEIMMRHINEVPCRLPAPAGFLQAIVDKLLKKDPTDRFPTAQHFIIALRGLMREKRHQEQVIAGCKDPAWKLRLAELGLMKDSAPMGPTVSMQDNGIPRWKPPAQGSRAGRNLQAWWKRRYRLLALGVIVLTLAILIFSIFKILDSRDAVQIAPDTPAAVPRATIIDDARFEKTGVDQLSDRTTGLRWAQADSGYALSWQEAQGYCNALGQELPTVDELRSIVDPQQLVPCGSERCQVSPAFRLQGAAFWSNQKSGELNAWYVNLTRGNRSIHAVEGADLVRALCVLR